MGYFNLLHGIWPFVSWKITTTIYKQLSSTFLSASPTGLKLGQYPLDAGPSADTVMIISHVFQLPMSYIIR